MNNDKLLELIIAKQDRMDDHLSDIKTTLAQNTSVLEEHQRRSLANEEAVSLMRSEFKPIREHVIKVQTFAHIFKLICAWTAGITAFLLSALGIYELILKLF
jgi:hypothetical protein